MNRDMQITANHRSGSSSLARCPRAGTGDLPKRNINRFTLQAVATEGNEGSREHRRASRAAPVHTISFVGSRRGEYAGEPRVDASTSRLSSWRLSRRRGCAWCVCGEGAAVQPEKIVTMMFEQHLITDFLEPLELQRLGKHVHCFVELLGHR
jgi:hypothetical protein